MGRGAVRSGPPTTGTVVNGGTTSNLQDPRIIIFDPPVRPCLVTHFGILSNLLIKVNVEPINSDGTVTNDFDNDTDDDGRGHLVIKKASGTTGATATEEVSMDGQLLVHSISLATTHPSDFVINTSVVGWTP